MEQKADDRILDKIKKCLALSASSEPHEAAAALRQAQKLMEKFGVSESDIGRADIGQVEFRSAFSVSNIKDYELALVSTVAKAFGCKILWKKSSSHAQGADVYGRYIMIGLKSQVPVAEYTVSVLQRKLVKARAQFVVDLTERHHNVKLDRAYKVKQADGFCQGWVGSVAKTVFAFALNEDTASLINDEVKRIASGKSAKTQHRDGGAAGYYAGQQAGAGESIHRPMGETKHKFLSK